MAQDSEGVTLAPDIARAGVAAVLNDPASPRGKYHVVEVDGDVIGQLFITFEWSDWRNAQIWWVQSVYVVPEHRRKGHYRALYQHVRQLALAQGVCGIRLYADDHNARAMTTYEALGMTSHYKVYEDMFDNAGMTGYANNST
ncbi:hypothetical protein WJX81_000798 [Elliptochloris bilobata]|uniref:N-acetyltransferase domain-containing protein n=1 Tax=Elliptochloris bilobata TaxID=381761 RepID=A0AAW1RBV3_9CHLO